MKKAGNMMLARKNAITGWLFVLPAFCYYLLIFFYPLVNSVVSSFYKVNILAHTYKFVGLKNYLITIKSQDFMNSVIVTFRYMAMFLPVILVVSLVLSVMLSKLKKNLAGFFIIILILPFISANITAGMIWNWLLDPVLGLVNNVTGSSNSWFRGSGSALLSVVIVGMWLRIGFNVIILVGSINSIPKEVYEATTIDGANTFQQFFKITLPLINPTLILVFTLEVIRSFRVFGEIMGTTQGGPGGATKSLMIYLIKDIFPISYGRATAVSVMLVIFLFVVSLLQRLLKKNTDY